jgi:hypothetical protein
MGLMGSPKRRQEITTIPCVTALKSAVLNFYVAGQQTGRKLCKYALY